MFVKKENLCMAVACIFCAATLVMAPAGPAGAENYKRIDRNADTDAENLYRLPASPTTTTTITARPGEWRDTMTGMDFVFVKGGCYEMGCGPWDGDCDDDENPVHTICVDDFYMNRHEVTNEQFVRFLNNVGKRGTKENPWLETKDEDDDSHITGLPGMFRTDAGYENHPVIGVSWRGAEAMAGWLSLKTGQTFRLPTEAEWEYACRSGGKPEKYCGGDNADRVAWYHGNSGRSTHPVGTKAPNGLGIYDMSGNVWEWCEDVYAEDAYGKHRRNNPIHTGSGSFRVLRGGGWLSKAWFCRSASRYWNMPVARNRDSGFRLAFSPGQ